MKTLFTGLLAACMVAPIFLAQAGPGTFAATRRLAATTHFAFSAALSAL